MNSSSTDRISGSMALTGGNESDALHVTQFSTDAFEKKLQLCTSEVTCDICTISGDGALAPTVTRPKRVSFLENGVVLTPPCDTPTSDVIVDAPVVDVSVDRSSFHSPFASSESARERLLIMKGDAAEHPADERSPATAANDDEPLLLRHADPSVAPTTESLDVAVEKGKMDALVAATNGDVRHSSGGSEIGPAVVESEPVPLHDEHGTKVVGVEFAPINVPFARRVQTLAAIHYVFVFLVFPIMCLWLPFYILFYTSYWWIVPLYAMWFAYDVKTPARGSRRCSWVRKMAVWRHLRDYFPIRLVKTAELDPNRNYIFGYHPHGIVSLGAFVNFCTDANHFDEMFPGVSASLMTLVGQFWFPFRREYAIAMGAVEVSRESIEYMLTRKGVGNAIVIVIGGAEEALDAHPGTYHLLLSRRKGFIKQAIKYGADLVPVFSFGENELFEQVDNPQGSALRRFQSYLKSHLGFSPPLFHGRGIFNYTFGLLPHRRPIYTVVGHPIHVEQSIDPSKEMIATLHAAYVVELRRIFEENKLRYGYAPEAHLDIY